MLMMWPNPLRLIASQAKDIESPDPTSTIKSGAEAPDDRAVLICVN
jgi:hypothetical protein